MRPPRSNPAEAAAQWFVVVGACAAVLAWVTACKVCDVCGRLWQARPVQRSFGDAKMWFSKVLDLLAKMLAAQEHTNAGQIVIASAIAETNAKLDKIIALLPPPAPTSADVTLNPPAP